MDVGEQLVDRLIAYGLKRVFGCPGGQTLALYNGIEARSGKIEHVLMHDERSGAFAADGYARATGRVGICDATVGPGASNLVSGLVEAYCSSIPVLAIVADIPRYWEHRRHMGSASQGFEQRTFLEGCVKWYGRVETPENLDNILHSCMRIATSGRPGPVVLEFPDDVFSSEAAPEQFAATAEWGAFPRLRPGADPTQIQLAVERLRTSDRPMVVAGGGALHSEAGPEIQALVELLGCPFATSPSGKGVVPETHPLAAGVAGRFGIALANRLLGEADCVIFIGSKAGQGVTMDWALPELDTPVIHIDVDGEEVGRNFRNTLGLIADARVGTAALVAALRNAKVRSNWDRDRIEEMRADWWGGAIEYKEAPVPGVLKPQDVARTLNRLMSDDDVVVTDASLSSGWAAGRWQTKRMGRCFFAPRGLAGLGWGLPAAIGVAAARRDLGQEGRTVCLAGDGGWGYSLTEVETAARKSLPVVSVVLNNSTLAWNKHSGESRYPGATVFEDFMLVDYARAAEAMNAHTAIVDTIDDFAAAFDSALHDDSDVPWVIDARSCAIETPVQKSANRASTY